MGNAQLITYKCMNIYLIKNDERKGPYSIEQVVDFIRKGEYLMSDFVWREGMTDWQPIHALADIVEAVLPPLPVKPEEQSAPALPPPIPIQPENQPLSLKSGQDEFAIKDEPTPLVFTKAGKEFFGMPVQPPPVLGLSRKPASDTTKYSSQTESDTNPDYVKKQIAEGRKDIILGWVGMSLFLMLAAFLFWMLASEWSNSRRQDDFMNIVKNYERRFGSTTSHQTPHDTKQDKKEFWLSVKILFLSVCCASIGIGGGLSQINKGKKKIRSANLENAATSNIISPSNQTDHG